MTPFKAIALALLSFIAICFGIGVYQSFLFESKELSERTSGTHLHFAAGTACFMFPGNYSDMNVLIGEDRKRVNDEIVRYGKEHNPKAYVSCDRADEKCLAYQEGYTAAVRAANNAIFAGMLDTAEEEWKQ